MEAQEHILPDGRTLIIRLAQVEDAAALLVYVETISGESTFISFGPGEFNMTVEKEEKYLRTCLESERRLSIVGEVDGDLVGFLNFAAGHRARTQHAGELGMSVRKAYWGLGIGMRMMQALIDWAPGVGVVKLSLRVRTDNLRAIRLYQRQGFIVQGTLTKEFLLDGVYYDLYFMGLEL